MNNKDIRQQRDFYFSADAKKAPKKLKKYENTIRRTRPECEQDYLLTLVT